MIIHELMLLAVQQGASDIHITVGSAPCFRIQGHLLPLNNSGLLEKLSLTPSQIETLSADQTNQMVREITTAEQYETFSSTGDLDFSYALESGQRFRVNAYRQQGAAALAIRIINSRIYSFNELGLPDVLAYLSRRPRGLVLVTGPTGSGKSTTLAAMVDLINSEQAHHIITLEDPIEFMHHHKKSLINQREIGRDTISFATALRSAMREDPDVILVGEMRDPETIAIAITAAETGHLVFGTLHTSSAAQTIDRIIDVFPPFQQQQIRVQLANAIQGVVAQQLIPRIDKPGRAAAVEIMVATPAIHNLIREGKTYQIISQIQTGMKYGMQSLDMSLKTLYQGKVISREEVINRALDPESLQKML